MKFLFCCAVVFFSATHFNFGENKKIIQQTITDTTKKDLQEFKQFAAHFFSAIKKGDTGFLKKHVLFPISNSSFSAFDRSLESNKSLSGTKNINSTVFFKKLHILFPNDLINGLDSAEFTISSHKGEQTLYIITQYDESSGVESNATWLFIRKSKEFYFINYLAEAG